MNWIAKTLLHQGTLRIAVYFEKNAALIARIKTFEDARWSANHKYWHLPDTEANRLHFNLPLLFYNYHLQNVELKIQIIHNLQ